VSRGEGEEEHKQATARAAAEAPRMPLPLSLSPAAGRVLPAPPGVFLAVADPCCCRCEDDSRR